MHAEFRLSDLSAFNLSTFFESSGRFSAFISLGAVTAKMTVDRFQCPNCLRNRPLRQRMKLWGGPVRCASCVRAFSPQLADFAAKHTRWEESAPWRPGNVWKKVILFETGLFLCIATLFASMMYRESGVMGIVNGITIAAIACAFQGAIQVPAWVWTAHRSLPKVVIENGVVSVNRGGCRDDYPLREMKWRLGKPKHDTMLRRAWIPSQTVVILSYPRHFIRAMRNQGRTRLVVGMPFIQERCACGWDNESRQVLIDFLTFCGVPQG